MSNTREINPQVPVWTPNGSKNAKFLALTNFFNYNFDNGGGIVTYKLIGEQTDNGTSTLEDGTVVVNPPSLTDLYQANLSVPANVVQSWGASDNVIFDYVATTLGLTLVPNI
jgi:hypothetical protein